VFGAPRPPNTHNLNVKPFFNIIKNCPCEKDDNILYSMYYCILREEYAMESSILGRDINQEGNPVICIL
jgi:hypothetical protein